MLRNTRAPKSSLFGTFKSRAVCFSTMVNLGDIFPDFEAETSLGPIKFHDWLGDS